VLVESAEGVDSPEGFNLRHVSVVRLRTLDLCLRAWRNEAGALSVVRLGLERDGESDFRQFLLRERGNVAGEVIDDRVERRAEVVEAVSDDGAEIARRLGPDLDRVDVLRSISLKVACDRVGVRFAEPLDGGVEHTDVFIRAIELEACAL
jgi:hypothetical protein